MPLCVTVSVLPAIVRLPLRDAVALFGVTEYLTLPLPVPEDPEVIESQPRFSDAVHAHPLAAVTVAVKDPAPAAADWDVGEIE